MDKKLIKKVFCADCQTVTDQVLSASPSGEVQTMCPKCKRVLKFAAGIDRKTFDQTVAEHKAGNEGQVTQESIEKTLAELAD